MIMKVSFKEQSDPSSGKKFFWRRNWTKQKNIKYFHIDHYHPKNKLSQCNDPSLNSTSFWPDVAPCQRELNDLVSKKKIEFGQKSRGKLGIILSERLNSVSGWRPKGILVAHLHEHQVVTYTMELLRNHFWFLINWPYCPSPPALQKYLLV